MNGWMRVLSSAKTARSLDKNRCTRLFERAASVPSLRHRRPSTSRTVVVGCGRVARNEQPSRGESSENIICVYSR